MHHLAIILSVDEVTGVMAVSLSGSTLGYLLLGVQLLGQGPVLRLK
jgi:hypothetical protein